MYQNFLTASAFGQVLDAKIQAAFHASRPPKERREFAERFWPVMNVAFEMLCEHNEEFLSEAIRALQALEDEGGK
ncbi:MAG: hypothetical protein WCT11_03880 [Candidatus Magasanikbacteria bacterium]